MPGRYIAFEGVEGCGKSTHVKRLAAHLDAIVTREPGGTVIGTTLREIMANTANTHLSPRAEALLMSADRAQHLHELVIPTLESGRHVISDRSVYSSLAYQGYGRQLDLAQLRAFNDFAINSRWPDLVVYLRVDLQAVRARLQKRDTDRFEREDDAFFRRVMSGFDELAQREPDRWLVIDATPPKDELELIIRRAVCDRLGL
ncbi:MAG: dTMP kinase [Ilumatobacteraceae bacterium]|jgi:dTMP kinase|nr:thymidylate kinase [Actinomycetes bacterium]